MHREYDPSQMGLDGVLAAGDVHHHPHGHDPHDHEGESKRLRTLTVVVGALLAGHLLLPFWNPTLARPLGIPLALLATVLGGGRIIYHALAALFEGKVGADIALAIATVAAAVMGEYFVAAEVVFIALLGECLEAYTFGRAQQAIRKLLDLRPRTARVLRDGIEIEVPADALRIGDLLVVRPGERIAADGTVIGGRSSVDQSALTGESLPVDKGPGEPVYTGTINAFGRLEIRAERLGAETTLGQVVRLLSEAQSRKSPLERTADRLARLFLPAVLGAALIVLALTNLGPLASLIRSGTLGGPIDVMPTLAVLVVACPCALILATPAAVLAATARLARRGVLVKGGAAIERLAAVDCLALDKTGTLTEGRPELGDLLTFEGWEPIPILRLAAAAEQSSEHPLARLLVQAARDRQLDLPAADDFRAEPGAGVSARVDGRTVRVGNARLFHESGVNLTPVVDAAIASLDASGQTALLVAVDDQVVGVVGARDTVRREAHDVVHELEHLGLTDVSVLTGDRIAPARAVAKSLHLSRVEAELSPAGKAEWIRDRQRERKVVAMVGDGINDAPALAMADVGIALAGVGTDIAAEAGSVLMMGDPLAPLPDAIRLARKTVQVIRQGILLFAFGLNGLAVVLAGLRVLGPVAAAILHQVGSLLVILNAMRLLGWEGFAQLGPARAAGELIATCRSCHPDRLAGWFARHRRPLAGGAAFLALATYTLSGVIVVEPSELGIVRRWGRFESLLGPGMHVRVPWPVERMIIVEPDRVRVARVGLAASTDTEATSLAWNAAHGDRRQEADLFLTGDENLVELSAVVEYRYGRDGLSDLMFGVAGLTPEAASDPVVETAAEAMLREQISRRTFETILVAERRPIEEEIRTELARRLAATGLGVAVDRVRILDAHPPREVVPSYRDVAAALSDAERFLNEAHGYADERRWFAEAEAQSRLDQADARAHSIAVQARGEREAFLARVASHSRHPELTEFRLLWDTIARNHAGRPKIILDPRVVGRRQIWLGDPKRFPAFRPDPGTFEERLAYPQD